MSRTLRKMILFMFFLSICTLLWIVLVKPLSAESSISTITVTKASSMQPEFLEMIQEQNGVDRVRLDNSKKAISNEADKYSIFRYTVQVTNPSFKDAIDVDFRIRPVEKAIGRFLVMNLNPVSLKVYTHGSRSFSFNVLVDTYGLTQPQIEDLKGKVQIDVTWREAFWTRSSHVELLK